MKQFLLKLPPYLPSVIVLMLLFYLTLVPQPLPPIEEPFLYWSREERFTEIPTFLRTY